MNSLLGLHAQQPAVRHSWKYGLLLRYVARSLTHDPTADNEATLHW